MSPDKVEIAYFSMENELEPDLPTYSGGLGVLAGDMLRTAADDGVPMVGVSLVHRKGYFQQKLDAPGQQSETNQEWSPETRLERLSLIVPVIVEGREVHVRLEVHDPREGRRRGPGHSAGCARARKQCGRCRPDRLSVRRWRELPVMPGSDPGFGRGTDAIRARPAWHPHISHEGRPLVAVDAGPVGASDGGPAAAAYRE